MFHLVDDVLVWWLNWEWELISNSPRTTTKQRLDKTNNNGKQEQPTVTFTIAEKLVQRVRCKEDMAHSTR